MNRPKFSKIYFPGLISLVFLPLMCIWYLVNNNSFQKYTAMQVIWLNNTGLREWEKRQSKFSNTPKMSNILTFRRYTELTLTGNTIQDISLLNKLTALLKEIAIKNDTINGISVTFGNHAKYNDVVNVLDVCNQNEDSQFVFMAINDKILMFHIAPDTRRIEIPLVSFGNDIIISKSKSPIISLEKINSGLRSLYKILIDFWPSVLAFILMLSFIILKKRRYLNLKTFRLVG